MNLSALAFAIVCISALVAVAAAVAILLRPRSSWPRCNRCDSPLLPASNVWVCPICDLATKIGKEPCHAVHAA